jgi:hypothetical protein
LSTSRTCSVGHASTSVPSLFAISSACANSLSSLSKRCTVSQPSTGLTPAIAVSRIVLRM